MNKQEAIARLKVIVDDLNSIAAQFPLPKYEARQDMDVARIETWIDCLTKVTEDEDRTPFSLDGIQRFYYTRFGTYRIEFSGVIARRLDMPADFSAPEAADYNHMEHARMSGTTWRPIGIDLSANDYGWIFERCTSGDDPDGERIGAGDTERLTPVIVGDFEPSDLLMPETDIEGFTAQPGDIVIYNGREGLVLKAAAPSPFCGEDGLWAVYVSNVDGPAWSDYWPALSISILKTKAA